MSSIADSSGGRAHGLSVQNRTDLPDTLHLSGGCGLGFVGGPLARSAAVLRKSCGFSYLPIRKGLILPFAGGVSPPLPVVSLLFSATYPQASRSYYLLFNYLFFTTCFRVSRIVFHRKARAGGVLCFTGKPRGGGIVFHRGKLSGSPKACGNKRFTPSDDSGARGSLEGPTRPAEAAVGPLRGRKGEPSLLAGLD